MSTPIWVYTYTYRYKCCSSHSTHNINVLLKHKMLFISNKVNFRIYTTLYYVVLYSYVFVVVRRAFYRTLLCEVSRPVSNDLIPSLFWILDFWFAGYLYTYITLPHNRLNVMLRQGTAFLYRGQEGKLNYLLIHILN